MWASSLLINLAVCLAFCMAMSLLTSPLSPCLRCQPRQVGDPLGGQRKLYRYHGFSKKLNLDMAMQSKMEHWCPAEAALVFIVLQIPWLSVRKISALFMEQTAVSPKCTPFPGSTLHRHRILGVHGLPSSAHESSSLSCHFLYSVSFLYLLLVP